MAATRQVWTEALIKTERRRGRAVHLVRPGLRSSRTGISVGIVIACGRWEPSEFQADRRWTMQYGPLIDAGMRRCQKCKRVVDRQAREGLRSE